MRRWASSAAVAVALGGAVALPVIGQESPRSILPPSFEEPPPPPVIVPREIVPTPSADDGPPPTVAPADTQALAPLPTAPDPYAVGAAPRDTRVTGWLTPAAGGYGERAFAGSSGAFVAGLMRRIDAPVASRWASILLRRALLSVVPTPAGVRPGDWVAERAWLLIRMGEVDGAKALVDAFPPDRFTPRLYAVAAQTHLAAADLPALCPLATTAVAISREPVWRLAGAMCAGLEGDDLTGTATFDGLRNREAADAFDIQLAERVASAASGSGRAANVEWGDVGRLTVFRFGVAAAAGVPIPERLTTPAHPAVAGWTLRAANLPIEARVAAAPAAAALGVSSADELVRLHAAHAEELDPFEVDAAVAGQLRTAFVGRTPADRLAAMRSLWRRGEGERDRYAAHILTATPAARLAVDEDHADAAPDLVGAMLSAGLVAPALRWWSIAEAEGGAVRDATWAQLVVADATGRVAATGDRFDDWAERERGRVGEARAMHRAALLAASLAGLGRGDDWGVEVPAVDNAYVRRLDAAAAAGRAGEVAVLAAVGLQSNWASVPPAHLQRILSALRRVGRGAEARSIAAEAMARA